MEYIDLRKKILNEKNYGERIKKSTISKIAIIKRVATGYNKNIIIITLKLYLIYIYMQAF